MQNKSEHSFTIYQCQNITLSKEDKFVSLILTPTLQDAKTMLKHGQYVLHIENTAWKFFYVDYALSYREIDFRNPTIQETIDSGIKSYLPLEKPLLVPTTSEFQQAFKQMLAYQGFFNLHAEVGITNYNRGKFLYSKDFGPCQAVFARLQQGEWGLYHASHCVENQNLFDFISSIKQDVVEVIVVQKTKNQNNFEKAPLQAIALAKHLPYTPVKVITVDNYRAILLYEDKVILGEKVSVVDSNNLQQECVSTSDLTPVDEKNTKTIAECVNEALKNDNFQFETMSDGSIKLPAIHIPATMAQPILQINLPDGCMPKKQSAYSPSFFLQPGGSVNKQTDLTPSSKTKYSVPAQNKKTAVNDSCCLLM